MAIAFARDVGWRRRRRQVCLSIVQFSSVFFQIEIAAESFAADTTRERLLLVVCMHVERQVVHLLNEKKTHSN